MRWRRYRAFRTRDGVRQYGWFATGVGVPEAGRIHWGLYRGRLGARLDCYRLAWKHRAQ